MMSRDLTIGKLLNGRLLRFPIDVVTQVIAIIGRRGVGKTHTARALAEELLALALQVVMIDPLDVWFGLKSSKDGKKAGYEVVIFGGKHADVPLLEGNGRAIAELIVSEGISCVLSTRHLSKKAQKRFVADFAEALYELKGAEREHSPMHLMIDEADAFCPQRVMADSARCMGAVDTLVRRGRSSGIGVTMITQRPAVLNKDVLSQAEVLVAMQVTGKPDKQALRGWIEDNTDQEQEKAFMSSLATLKVGEAWVWSPGWLGILERVKIRDTRTFDSSATPKVGQKVVAPKKLAAIDLAAIEAKLAEAIEEAKANDPRHLKREVARLVKRVEELESWKAIPPDALEGFVSEDVMDESIRVAVHEAIGSERARVVDDLCEVGGSALELHDHLRTVLDGLKKMGEVYAEKPLGDVPIPKRKFTPAPSSNWVPIKAEPASVRKAVPGSSDGTAVIIHGRDNGSLSRYTLDVVRVIGAVPEGLHKDIIALMSKKSVKSSQYQKIFPMLEREGVIEKSGDRYKLTAAALVEYGPFPAVPTGPELVDFWAANLGNYAGDLLRCIVEHGPVTRDEIGEKTGKSLTSSQFDKTLVRLRKLALVDGERRGDWTASEVFG